MQVEMLKSFLFALFSLLLNCSFSSQDELLQRATTFTLRVSTTGTRNESLCRNGSEPCASLNMVLNILRNKSDLAPVRVLVDPGNYTLQYGEYNRIDGMTDLTIVGSGEEDTVVTCEPSVGLYISNSNLTITAITFMNCGHDAELILSNIVGSPLQPAAIISTTGCLTLKNVTILDSNGSGILIYNPNECNETMITNTTVIGGIGIPNRLGGGIIIIGDYYSIYKPQFVISNCIVQDNNYYMDDTPITSDLMIESAALTLIEMGSSIVVDSCVISNNNRGFSLYEAEHFAFNISNSAILSNWNDSVIVIINTGRVHMSLHDASITDLVTVDQRTYGVFNPSGPDDNDCQVPLNSLKMSLHCSGVTACSVPLIDFKYSCELESYSNYGDITPGVCSNDSYNYNYRGQCPVPYSFSVRRGNHYVYGCWDNHEGPLCGQCLVDHSVAINSPYLACVECSEWSTIIKGWCFLILFEFLPLTIMVFVIIILNINLNQGSLKAFVFFSQMLMIPFPSVSYPSWFVTSYSFDYRYINLFFVPFQMWVLGFINYPSCNTHTFEDYTGETTCNNMSICISSHTSALGAISFWYLIAFYPFVLLLLIYACMIGYKREYKCFVCVLKPIHRLLNRLWQKFGIKPSFTQNVASMYTLCFTQLAAISFKILHSTRLNEETVFFYDGSQKYFSGWHGAAGTLALIVLIVFIAIPTLYLALYPILRKYLLEKLGVLSTVADAITDPYRHETLDYRYFACSHYILQLLFMFLYFFPDQTYAIFIVQIIFCGLFVAVLAVIRPYKKTIHTVIYIILLLILISFSIALLILNIDIEHFTVPIVLAIYVLPVLYLCLFLISCFVCFIWIPVKLKAAFYTSSTINGIQSDKDTISLLGHPIPNSSYSAL